LYTRSSITLSPNLIVYGFISGLFGGQWPQIRSVEIKSGVSSWRSWTVSRAWYTGAVVQCLAGTQTCCQQFHTKLAAELHGSIFHQLSLLPWQKIVQCSLALKHLQKQSVALENVGWQHRKRSAAILCHFHRSYWKGNVSKSAGTRKVEYAYHVCCVMLCISAAYAVMQCLSVCVSVTFMDHVKTNKHMFEIFHHRVATPF